KAVREIKREQSYKVTPEQKLEVLESIAHKSHSESQHQVAAFFDLPVIQESTKKVQADESVRLEFTLSKENYEKLNHAQDLLSHAVPTSDLAQFVVYLTEKVIKQKAVKAKDLNSQQNQNSLAHAEPLNTKATA